MKLIIGILACHHRAHHLSACRETWLKDSKVDYKFFFGRGQHENPLPDEVTLDCDDAYSGLACKVQSSVRWALENGYDAFFKVDDDTYVRPERVLTAGFERNDFTGVLLGATDRYHEHAYARGGTGYYLSKRAMQALATAPIPNPDIPSEYAEDSWVGKTLLKAGIECENDNRLRCAAMSGPNRTPRPNGFTGWRLDCPTASNDFITVCEFLGDEMRQVHKEWLASQDAKGVIFGRLKIR